mmetsp:Transcript_4172/g.18533  ORF Transcript_4172/g.18533 Transcript_4172/m.18533 type:complete len:236 (+) Transcript_4172:75-782(+)
MLLNYATSPTERSNLSFDLARLSPLTEFRPDAFHGRRSQPALGTRNTLNDVSQARLPERVAIAAEPTPRLLPSLPSRQPVPFASRRPHQLLRGHVAAEDPHVRRREAREHGHVPVRYGAKQQDPRRQPLPAAPAHEPSARPEPVHRNRQHQDHQRGARAQERDEPPVVVATHAVADGAAVVVKALDAVAALGAVRGARGTPYLARAAPTLALGPVPARGGPLEVVLAPAAPGPGV